MKTLTESIIGRKNSMGGWPVLDKIRNPEFSDLVPYNIVKVDYSEPHGSKYGIIVPEDIASKFFGIQYREYKGKCGSVLFYDPATYGEIVFVAIDHYKKQFPRPFINRVGFEIIDIWDGSKAWRTFEYRLKTVEDYAKFLRWSVDKPEEFERMLKP